jgi:RNA polymerase sigma-70 factor, ECF subfamily
VAQPLDDRSDARDSNKGEVTRLLEDLSGDRQGLLVRLYPLIYNELRMMARRVMRDSDVNRTISPTALVNEVYLRLMNQDATWQNKQHFFSIAATAMRRILVDAARARQTDKRGGSLEKIRLDDDELEQKSVRQSRMLVDLDDALDGLSKLSPQQCQIIELMYFGGLKQEQVAEVLHISRRTVNREARAARAWLKKEIERS